MNEIIYILEHYNWIITTIIGGFIAYHVYYLSKEISIQDNRKDLREKKEQIRNILQKIYAEENMRSKVFIYDDKKTKKYPKYGFKAELFPTSDYDIHIYTGKTKNIYITKEGKYTFNERRNKFYKKCYVIECIPYEYVSYIDINSDDWEFCPKIFCKFFIKPMIGFNNVRKIQFYVNNKSPFSHKKYYIESDKFTSKEYYWERYMELFVK